MPHLTVAQAADDDAFDARTGEFIQLCPWRDEHLLTTICERKKRAAEALGYNGLVQSWPEIQRLSRERSAATAEQRGLFDGA